MAQCLERAQGIGVDWASASGLSDEDLESRLYPPTAKVPVSERPAVDWALVHKELKKKGMTLEAVS